uniref:Uncharacterized protein n=1 Tax=Periophthalmus magnuspinnatus TaxID=409849 RepID=A0A3B4BB96_9GOBI
MVSIFLGLLAPPPPPENKSAAPPPSQVKDPSPASLPPGPSSQALNLSVTAPAEVSVSATPPSPPLPTDQLWVPFATFTPSRDSSLSFFSPHSPMALRNHLESLIRSGIKMAPLTPHLVDHPNSPLLLGPHLVPHPSSHLLALPCLPEMLKSSVLSLKPLISVCGCKTTFSS